MDKLIEQLWKEFMCKPLVDGGYTKKDGFKQAIQTACEAQRNACLREWTNTHFDYEIGCNILTAEIRKEDYE